MGSRIMKKPHELSAIRTKEGYVIYLGSERVGVIAAKAVSGYKVVSIMVKE